MRQLTVSGIDVRTVEQTVGTRVYADGVRYAKQRAVLRMEWDDDEHTLTGLVRGSSGTFHDAAVYFGADLDGGLHFGLGECSCPVVADCKHAAALALVAAG
ncbi:MAG TPA: hypothetical protein VIQ30_08720, partial [Pseudonocardia sp.]